MRSREESRVEVCKSKNIPSGGGKQEPATAGKGRCLRMIAIPAKRSPPLTRKES